ncbi:hypothetical protein PGQ11_015642 [Apiospora arundinis]|uniref:Uncharacterized protein n=1 Tax=Apiospora arundinis TaxID=335852 RepID=A0ABR2HLY6_9PEZI
MALPLSSVVAVAPAVLMPFRADVYYTPGEHGQKPQATGTITTKKGRAQGFHIKTVMMVDPSDKTRNSTANPERSFNQSLLVGTASDSRTDNNTEHTAKQAAASIGTASVPDIGDRNGCEAVKNGLVSDPDQSRTSGSQHRVDELVLVFQRCGCTNLGGCEDTRQRSQRTSPSTSPNERKPRRSSRGKARGSRPRRRAPSRRTRTRTLGGGDGRRDSHDATAAGQQ